MSFVGVSPRVIYLLFLVTLGLALGLPCNSDETPELDDCDINDAYATKQGSRKLLHASEETAEASQSLVPVLNNRRSLLEAMCSETDNSAHAVVQCTNAVRSSPSSFVFPCGRLNMNGGLGPLSAHEKLMDAAKRHSNDNAKIGDLTHRGSDGSFASTRVRRAGYSPGMVRENIAYGYLSARSVVFGWMCSSGHRKNIMSCDIADIGVGLAQGRNGRYYHTQVFACPQGQQCTCSGGGGGSGEEEEEKPVASPVEGGGHQEVPSSEHPYKKVPYQEYPHQKQHEKPHSGGGHSYDYPPYYGHGSGPSHSGGEEEEGEEAEPSPMPIPYDPYMPYGHEQGGHGGQGAFPFGMKVAKSGKYVHVIGGGHSGSPQNGFQFKMSMPGHGEHSSTDRSGK